MVTLDDFRIKIKRSMALQASYNDNHLRDVGQRLEREARAQFQILLDPAECLHLLIEKELGGADVSESCQVNDRAPCCNCRRRWECVEQKHRLIAILESGAPSKEKSKARTELKKMLTVRNELKSHTIGIGGWTEDRIVSGKKMIVLCRNEEVTKSIVQFESSKKGTFWSSTTSLRRSCRLNRVLHSFVRKVAQKMRGQAPHLLSVLTWQSVKYSI